MKVKTNLRAGKKSGTVLKTSVDDNPGVESVETVSVPVSRCVGI